MGEGLGTNEDCIEDHEPNAKQHPAQIHEHDAGQGTNKHILQH